jgi:hypothetical protein
MLERMLSYVEMQALLSGDAMRQPEGKPRKLNQYATRYTFGDGSYLVINTRHHNIKAYGPDGMMWAISHYPLTRPYFFGEKAT